MTQPPNPSLRLRIRSLILATAVVAFAFAIVAGLFLRPLPDSPVLHDPRFAVTTRATVGNPANAPLNQRIFAWWMQNRHRFQKPRPMAYTFPASPTNRCSIHGLLNQCMEVTGVRYVIARDVAGGSVQFGHTNTLNGTQWVSAFTEALQSGEPEWWDPQAKAFRKESLVLITNAQRMVLVLPKDMVAEFRPGRSD